VGTRIRENTDIPDLGARMRALRLRSELSQEALDHRPHPSTLAALADALGLQPSERDVLVGSPTSDASQPPIGSDDAWVPAARVHARRCGLTLTQAEIAFAGEQSVADGRRASSW
jgi:hypothetical protein